MNKRKRSAVLTTVLASAFVISMSVSAATLKIENVSVAEKTQNLPNINYVSSVADHMTTEIIGSPLKNSYSTMTKQVVAQEEADQVEIEKEIWTKPYETFGLIRDPKTDVYTYQGEKVKCFWDENEVTGQIKMFARPYAGIYVKAVRNEENKLSGMKIASQEEVTEMFGNQVNDEDISAEEVKDATQEEKNVANILNEQEDSQAESKKNGEETAKEKQLTNEDIKVESTPESENQESDEEALAASNTIKDEEDYAALGVTHNKITRVWKQDDKVIALFVDEGHRDVHFNNSKEALNNKLYLKVVRDSEDRITSIEQMTEEDIEALKESNDFVARQLRNIEM